MPPAAESAVLGAAPIVDRPHGRRSAAVSALASFDAILLRVVEAVLVLSIVVDAAVVLASVVLRSAFSISPPWANELAQDILEVMCFVGAYIALVRGSHFALEMPTTRLPPRYRDPVYVLRDLVILVTAVLAAWLSIPLLQQGLKADSLVLPVRVFWEELPTLVGLVLIAYGVVRYRLIRHRPRTLAIVTLASLVVVTLGWALVGAAHLVVPAGALGFATFVVLMVIGVPMSFVFVATAIVSLQASQLAAPTIVPQVMWYSIHNFVYLAVPFFVWAGYIMVKGGLSAPLTAFIRDLVGHRRGGVLQVAVATMFVYSGLSGSKIADVAAIGRSMRDVAVTDGYSEGQLASVLAASAALGETIPPSIAMVVLASITSLSTAALFMAGILPAAVLSACLMAAIHLESVWRGRREQRARPPYGAIARAFVRALPALFVPVVLIGGILGGIASPTEVSAVAVLYGLLAALFYRKTGWRDLWGLTAETISLAAAVLLMLSTANAFAWVLSVAQVPQDLAKLVEAWAQAPWVFMLATIVVVALVGAVLEGLPALLVLAPLLMPMAAKYQIDPIQYGIVLVMAMGIGAFSPPIGVGLYATCLIVGADLRSTLGRMSAYVLVLLAGLLVVAFVPPVSLLLPQLLGLH
ncbi:MAG: TRAP transporter large permease subunit [Chloroflexota bacterium]|nr:TRAP transporter large permease subunit [Chloroflexota bacterium]